FVRIHLHRHAAEVLAIGIRRMRTDAYAELFRSADGASHRCLIAEVTTARDVRRIDELPDLFLAFCAFAKIGGDVDVHSSDPFVSGSSHTSTPPTAKN